MDKKQYDFLKSPVLIYRLGDKNMEGRIQKNMAVLPPAVETKTYIKKEIHTILHKNSDVVYHPLKFEDVKKFFNSLSLEEERELSGLLSHFYENTTAHQEELEKREEQAKLFQASLQTLTDQIQEGEKEQKQKRTQDEAARIRSLTDAVRKQLTQELRIEKMRRGHSG